MRNEIAQEAQGFDADHYSRRKSYAILTELVKSPFFVEFLLSGKVCFHF